MRFTTLFFGRFFVVNYPMKTYQAIPIDECGEPLVTIPVERFAFTLPHPYTAFGAPYGAVSPWQLRAGVLAALDEAQARLNGMRPGWRLKLFDAYRPLSVQRFMVWREFGCQANHRNLTLTGYDNPSDLAARAPELYATLAPTVFEFWSMPSDDMSIPPPHSTGAAIDLTLEDAQGQEVNMGCPIDETSARAYPDHYARSVSPQERDYYAHRQLLHAAMSAAGFSRHPNEWWHFSLGDQLWAWACGKNRARYGRVE